ncbi:MAG TPA: hypothetical protein VL403_05055 [Candidatus Kryptonia bacterium]|nr:hypothetical protein [Candidatus Kryptonia bacterium]
MAVGTVGVAASAATVAVGGVADPGVLVGVGVVETSNDSSSDKALSAPDEL